MRFLSGQEITTAISRLSKQKRFDCAVAFWGEGGERFVQKPVGRVICNLAMGGTNPKAIRKLRTVLGSANVLQMDTLHAKVYIGDHEAVVTSANASANGLGLEGTEQASWDEAGVVIPAAATASWFDALWKRSRRIDEADLKRAERQWRARRLNRPSLASFADFDAGRERIFLLFLGTIIIWIGP